MADDPRQPVAIRVSRPYANEDEYLSNELEMITRTSVVLVGAQSRPQGVILRFEVALSNGTVLLRGEGRVVGHKARALGELPGLTLRFTRLDARSKALIDRAAALREARARAALEESLSESVLPEAQGAAPEIPIPVATPLPFSVVPAITSLGPEIPAPSPPRPASVPPPALPELETPSAPLVAPRSAPPARAPSFSPPRHAPPAAFSAPTSGAREPLLDKLRDRARSLSPERVQGILKKRQG